MQAKTECTPLNLNQKLVEDLNNADTAEEYSPSETDAAFFPMSRNYPTKPNVLHSKRVQEFMLVLALCNTVVISTHSHNNEVNRIFRSANVRKSEFLKRCYLFSWT